MGETETEARTNGAQREVHPPPPQSLPSFPGHTFLRKPSHAFQSGVDTDLLRFLHVSLTCAHFIALYLHFSLLLTCKLLLSCLIYISISQG